MAARARRGELSRIVDEYGADAVATFGVPVTFTRADRAWVLVHSSTTLDEIEKGTRRRIALRVSRSISQAATLLGISHVALGQWLKRRRGPVPHSGPR